MNAKLVKRIRRQMKYHPTHERLYETIKTIKRTKDGTPYEFYCHELSAKCSRYQYQQFKKELKAG